MEVLLFFGLVIILLYLLFKSPSKKDQNPNSYDYIKKHLFVDYLKEAKNKGITTIDELIEQTISYDYRETNPNLAPPIEKNDENERVNIVEKEDEDIINSDIDKNLNYSKPVNFSPKPFIDKSNASFLLYVGAFLVVFSIFSFVAFNWENFNSIAKSLIIIISTISFYVAGFTFYKSNRFKDAGLVFIYIASISFAFTGIGLWNFLLKDSWPYRFDSFWLMYSLFMLIVYYFTFYILNKRNFFYFALASIYSIIISFSFTLSTDEKYRIVVISVLNLLFYIAEPYFKEKENYIKFVSRFLNEALNFIILIVIISNLSNLNSMNLRFIALFAIAVPSIFEIYSYVKNKFILERNIFFWTFPFKLFLICLIFSLQTESIVLIMLLCCIFYTIISEFIVLNRKEETLAFQITKSISWLITIILSIFIVLSAINIIIPLDKFISILTISALLINLLIPDIFQKRFNLLSYNINYSIFAVFLIQKILNPGYSFSDMLGISILFLLASTALNIFTYYKFKDIDTKNLFSKLILLSYILTLIISLSSLDPLKILISFFILHAISLILSYILGSKEIRLISVILNFVWITALINLLKNNKIEINAIQSGLIYTIPVVGYMISIDFLHYVKKYFIPEIFGLILFSLVAIFYYSNDIVYLFFSSIFFLIYFIYALFRFNNKDFWHYIFLDFLISFLIGLVWAKADFYQIITGMSVAVLLCGSLGILLKYFQIETKYKNLLYENNILSNNAIYANVGLLVLLAFNIFNTNTNSLYCYGLSCVVVFMHFLLLSRENIIWRNISGISLLFLVWNLGWNNSVNIQICIVPVVVYLFILSFIYFYSSITNIKDNLSSQKDLQTSKTLEISAYILEFTVLTIQSIIEIGELNVIFGIMLILLCLALLIWALARNNKELIYLSLIYLGIELLIRLYVVLLSISIWIYIGFFGLILIGVAVYILGKIGIKNE